MLAISSHVTHGHVGLAATVPALQWLGHEVWALPTVLLASRPGLGRMARHPVPPAELAAMLAALEADGSRPQLDAVLTGYFPSADAVAVVADAVARIKQATPGMTVLVDPIVGDASKLYVPQQTAEAIRDRLLPLAIIATPNLFELRWLANVADVGNTAQVAAGLGPPCVIVTSAKEENGRLSSLLVQGTRVHEATCKVRPGIPNGAGDLFAGLMLGYILNGRAVDAALDAALADLDRVLAASENRPVLQLSALASLIQ